MKRHVCDVQFPIMREGEGWRKERESKELEKIEKGRGERVRGREEWL